MASQHNYHELLIKYSKSVEEAFISGREFVEKTNPSDFNSFFFSTYGIIYVTPDGHNFIVPNHKEMVEGLLAMGYHESEHPALEYNDHLTKDKADQWIKVTAGWEQSSLACKKEIVSDHLDINILGQLVEMSVLVPNDGINLLSQIHVGDNSEPFFFSSQSQTIKQPKEIENCLGTFTLNDSSVFYMDHMGRTWITKECATAIKLLLEAGFSYNEHFPELIPEQSWPDPSRNRDFANQFALSEALANKNGEVIGKEKGLAMITELQSKLSYSR